MRLDTVTAEIRPRSDWESVDLGLALVRRDFWRCLLLWWLALGVPVLLGGWWLWDAPALFLMLFWLGKPAGSRLVLFQLSRRLFGEQPTWRAIWRELPRVWWRRFFYRFVWARLSPSLPVTLAVGELEGLRGKAYKQRVAQVLRRGSGVVVWTYLVAELAAGWFGLALFALLAMLIPEGQDAPWSRAMEEWDGNPFDTPVLLLRTVAVCAMLAMSLTDIFLTGAGFGLYVNTRTWIEGWDVELAFKRMAQRLGKVLPVLVLAACLVLPSVGRGEGEDVRAPHSVIEQVKAEKEFVVHKVQVRVPKSHAGAAFGLAPFIVDLLGWLFVVAAVGLVVWFLAWLWWKYRHRVLPGVGGATAARPLSARVVMGMEVTPESLPPDIPAVAWNLWQQGRMQEAMGLLYRGAISRVIERARVEIQQADTEGDCLRRVERAGAAAHPAYFRGLTGAWIGLAYAGRAPADAAVEALCREWPFVEGGAA